jgi:60 kDa SS-A/Ro ribonucleoprotein
MPKRNDPYARLGTRRKTVHEPLSTDQVPNVSGGYVFAVDQWNRLDRFLILGTQGGTYYHGEGELTRENATVIERCLTDDYVRTIDRIVEISVAGRNPKQKPLLFAYAMACGWTDDAARAYALRFLNDICRTGTMLFTWAGYVENFRGWGKGLQRAVARWYTEPRSKSDEPIEMDGDPAAHAHWLAYQAVKYKQREGWGHRDLLRLAKPGAPRRPAVERNGALDAVLAWMVGKPLDGAPLDTLLQAHDEVHEAGVKPKRIAEVVEMFRLPWEALPSEALGHTEVWNALLPALPFGALVRNLGRMTANGTLKQMSGQSAAVVSRLTNKDQVQRSRIHPLNVLTAASTYAHGQGVRGSLRWQPVPQITQALDKTFGMAFHNVEPANKRTLVCLDVSGSMDGSRIADTFLTAREASSAMALVHLATEPQVGVMAFSRGFIPINLHAGMSLADVIRTTQGLPFDATDCSLPMKWAKATGTAVDTFIIYTDSETNRGGHPVQALRDYRKHSGIPAKMIVVATSSNGFSIADPNDAGMLDVVGFDSAAPALIADFSAGRI